MQNHDVIIVGAGPSGSMLAYLLAKSGKSVALLDRFDFKREKPCGDGIGPRSFWLLKQLGLEEEAAALGWGPVDKIRLNSFSGQEVSSPLALGLVPIGYGYIIKRFIFDDFLRKKAVEAGAEFVPGCQVQRLLSGGGWITGVSGIKSDHAFEIKAPLTVLATGHSRNIDAPFVLPGSRFKVGEAVAVRTYLEKTTPTGKEIHIFFDRKMPRGFGWVFPTGKNQVNFGIGLLTPLELQIKKTAEKVLYEKKGAKEMPAGVWKGAPMRMDFGLSGAISFPGLALIGEAAGLVSPINGEGVCFALESALALTEILETYAKELSRSHLSTALEVYEKEMRHRHFSYFYYARWFQSLLRFPSVMDRMIASAAKRPDFAAVMLGVLGNTVHPRDLIRPIYALNIFR